MERASQYLPGDQRQGGFSSFLSRHIRSLPRRAEEGSRWPPRIAKGLGWGQDTRQVFGTRAPWNAWEWRSIKDNRRPVKGSEEQDAVLVHRRVPVIWCAALIGRPAGWIFDLRRCSASNDTRFPFQRRFRLTLFSLTSKFVAARF